MLAEQALEKYLCKQVKANGGMCIKLVGLNGIPDRLVSLPDGRNVYVEMKTDGGRLEPIQQAVHRKLKSMNQQVYTLWDYKQVDRFIEHFFGRELC